MMERWPQLSMPARCTAATPAARTVNLATGMLTVHAQPGQYPLDALIGFAARANAKRGFLFVSKVLGKHWPVRPSVMAALHDHLARGVPAGLPGPVLFIAMAETAVGLGQGVFEVWRRSVDGEALFLHTTRYRVGDGPLIEFEEAHSHAPRQFLHMPVDGAMAALMRRARSIVLVDDEASTGNTFVNLAAACRTVAPDLSHVHLVTITNFMGEAGKRDLHARMGMTVSHHAALDGGFNFVSAPLPVAAAPAQRYDSAAARVASACFGRLGLTGALALPPALTAALAARLAVGRSGANHNANASERALANGEGGAGSVLVLGTGECMHPAFLLGQALERAGLDVLVQSTTRSPILAGGAIAIAMTFADNYGEGIANYLYNVEPGQYDHVLICHETAPGEALYALARRLGARLLHFISELEVEEIPVR